MTPVLLTASATILGLIPLAVGLNIDFATLFTHFNPHLYFGGDSVAFWGPLSWTMIFGLAFATFLTLVLVPVMYLLRWEIKDSIRERKAMFKNIFSGKGRITRKEFELSFVMYILYYVVLGIAMMFSPFVGMVILLFLPAAIWFIYAQGAKRCHDIGRSGWHHLVPFSRLKLLDREGVAGENKYGADPRAAAIVA
jgi:uncharacterized membrane protein YhaH (DUF805 family)